MLTVVGAQFTTLLNGGAFGFDFNPTVDRIRVTSDAVENLRLNPDTGTVTVDVNLNPGNPNVVGSAYTNNFAGATTTTLYDIDSNLDILAIQNPPNNGTLNTVGSLGLNTSDLVGFDISQQNPTAYASLTVGGISAFYTINLTSWSGDARRCHRRRRDDSRYLGCSGCSSWRPSNQRISI